MPRGAREHDRTVFECREAFAIYKGSVPDVYPPGRMVMAGDPILRTHGKFFVETADRVERATAVPGERRDVHIPEPDTYEQEAEVSDA